MRTRTLCGTSAMRSVPARNAHSPLINLRRRVLSYCAFVFLLSLLPAGQGVIASPTQTPPPVSVLAGLPQYFIANAGQLDSQVRYYTKGSGQSIYFTDDGVHFVLRSGEEKDQPGAPATAVKTAQPSQGSEEAGLRRTSPPGATRVQSAQLVFIGANPDPVIEAEQPLAGRVNYLIGNDPDKWHTAIPTYGAVVYRELYPGIDVRFYGRQGTLEYDLIVAPGADPKQVRFRYAGAEGLSLNEAGDLVIALSGGELIQRRPVVYQEVNGVRSGVKASFALTPVSGDGVDQLGVTVGFKLAAYDKERTLVIDPVLNFSSFLGGLSNDRGFSVDVDGEGRVYVAGETFLTIFPWRVPTSGAWVELLMALWRVWASTARPWTMPPTWGG